MPNYKSWGVRAVKNLLMEAAADPETDPLWTIVADSGVSSQYFLGKAQEEIMALKLGVEKKRHFLNAVRYLTLWYCYENPKE